jgi:hypothetical protein
LSKARRFGCAPVLKLHGSVDWCVSDQKVAVDSKEDLPVRCHGDSLVLGVPGPNKAGIRNEIRALDGLWESAIEAIRNAARIVFVGYRFPQTDAYARVEFLHAILFAAKAANLKSVEIVLGPDLGDKDVARMKQLLGYALREYEKIVPKVLPLYAEDFLSLDRLE